MPARTTSPRSSPRSATRSTQRSAAYPSPPMLVRQVFLPSRYSKTPLETRLDPAASSLTRAIRASAGSVLACSELLLPPVQTWRPHTSRTNADVGSQEFCPPNLHHPLSGDKPASQC